MRKADEMDVATVCSEDDIACVDARTSNSVVETQSTRRLVFENSLELQNTVVHSPVGRRSGSSVNPLDWLL